MPKVLSVNSVFGNEIFSNSSFSGSNFGCAAMLLSIAKYGFAFKSNLLTLKLGGTIYYSG